MLKRYFYRFGLYITFLSLIGCEERKPLPVKDFYHYSDIRKIEVTVNNSQYKLFISPPIDISVNAFNTDGKKVAIPDSLIALSINDKSFKEDQFTPSDTGIYVLKARFGDVESTPVSIRSEDVIKDLEVTFSRSVFYQEEENEPIKILVSAKDKDNNVLVLTDSSHVAILVDGKPLTGNSFLPDQVGDFRIQARLREHRSSLLVFKSIHPNSVAKYIRPLAYSTGGTRFAIENQDSKFTLRAEVLDEGRNVLPFSKNIRFYSGGSELSDNVYEVKKAGNYAIVAKGYGIVSEPVEIVIRPELTFPVERLPVIFHFIDQPVPSQEDLNLLISNINKAFRGYNLNPTFAQDPNAVDCFIEFELAGKSPDGKILERPGVHSVTTERVGYKEEEITRSGEGNPLYVNFWDPDKYLNLWVLNVADASWVTKLTFSVSWGGGKPPIDKPLSMLGIWYNRISVLHDYTLIRNLGYFLGLNDPYSEGPYSYDCSWDSDNCGDTPRYNRETVKNSNMRVSCEGFEFLSTNYMDLSPGIKNSFTYDQRTILQNTLEKGIWIPTLKNRK